MAEIGLVNGGFAVVDDESLPLMGARRWRRKSDHGRTYVYSSTRPQVALHRLIADPPAGMMVDHINGNGLDNRRANLRVASNSQNQANRQRVRGAYIKGICFHRKSGKWQAQIKKDDVNFYLGLYASEEAAAHAYAKAAHRLFGEFAWTNFEKEACA